MCIIVIHNIKRYDDSSGHSIKVQEAGSLVAALFIAGVLCIYPQYFSFTLLDAEAWGGDREGFVGVWGQRRGHKDNFNKIQGPRRGE